MNNCPKCGNPLQPGTVSCPICGTNINQAMRGMVTPNVASNQQMMSGVAMSPGMAQPMNQPVQQPMNQMAQPGGVPIINNQMNPQMPSQALNIAGNPNMMHQQPTVQPMPQAISNVNNLHQQPLTNSVSQAVQPIQAQATKPAAPQGSPLPQSEPTKVPAAPTEAPTSNAEEVPKAQEPTPATPKEKKPIDKKILIIGGAVTAVLIIIIVLIVVLGKVNKKLDDGSNSSTVTPNTVLTSQVTNGGYNYSLPSGWQSGEIDGQYFIYTDDQSVIILVETLNANIDLLTENSLKKNMEDKGLTDAKVTSKTFANNRKGFCVSGKNNDIDVEFYYIDNDTDILYAGVVYVTSEAKTTYSETVQNIVYNVKYIESVNAINSVSMYYESIASGRDVEFDNENLPDNSSDNSQDNTTNNDNNTPSENGASDDSTYSDNSSNYDTSDNFTNDNQLNNN